MATKLHICTINTLSVLYNIMLCALFVLPLNARTHTHHLQLVENWNEYNGPRIQLNFYATYFCQKYARAREWIRECA